MNKLLSVTLLAALSGAAFAQMSAGGSSPADATVPAQTPAGLTARASVARYTSSPVKLTLTVSNQTEREQELSASRDNRQDCAAGPMVRVLEAGSRNVVYPPAGNGNAMLCAQDLFVKTVAAGGSVRLERTLDLPAGDYMIESWFSGNAADGKVKLPAEPVRVTVW
ncbi:hypothetical protein GCM10017783_00980 [Deinococcus piscis]|uniref:Intracellular proteinase inhibitor BsuPI domain-containing protein n=1 Tax=Deinococcus piscis TaxID=394230 RepID=A0ABQ3JWE1_9DEIO|nr:hypothetical protein [Deinococcus piscis]GHF92927.1 hypothetical protein GCM10017783_00980 [Deinococcus piscis]